MDAWPQAAPLVWILVAGVGACVGSFLNVCIHRLPERRSIVRPGSSCPRCAAPIAWHDNVPVLSYLILYGKCRRCGAPISARYPIVEAVTALLFVGLFALYGPTAQFLAQAWLAASLVALILIDARHQILPDALTLPGIAIGLLTSPFRRDAPNPLLDAAAGAALGYAIPWLINAAYRGWQAARRVPRKDREDGVGAGDFKLLAMIGAFLGPAQVLFVLFAGSVTGALFGAFMMLRRGYGWKSRLPFGVFLGAAAIVAQFAGAAVVRWYAGRLGAVP